MWRKILRDDPRYLPPSYWIEASTFSITVESRKFWYRNMGFGKNWVNIAFAILVSGPETARQDRALRTDWVRQLGWWIDWRPSPHFQSEPAILQSFCQVVGSNSKSSSAFFSSSGVRGSLFVPSYLRICGVRDRAMMGTSLWYSWSISLMALAGIAYLIPDRRLLCIVTGTPAIPLVLGFL